MARWACSGNFVEIFSTHALPQQQFFAYRFCFGPAQSGSKAMKDNLWGFGLPKRSLFRFVLFTIALLISLSPITFADQSDDRPEDGGHEIQIWSGGGHSVPGGTKNVGVWNLGLRYGWVLTKPHLPGPLKGRFELGLDAVPVFVVFQRFNNAYGGGVDPVVFKWIFATRGRFAPFFELNGGTLASFHNVPYGTSQENFTTTGGVGTYFFGEHAWSLDVRFLHISNAGLTVPNPGINTVQVRLGFGKFFKKK
jgi:hypothetical protein